MWWVEVVGEVELEFPIGTYSLFFRLQLGKASRKLGRRVCNLAQVHGCIERILNAKDKDEIMQRAPVDKQRKAEALHWRAEAGANGP